MCRWFYVLPPLRIDASATATHSVHMSAILNQRGKSIRIPTDTPERIAGKKSARDVDDDEWSGVVRDWVSTPANASGINFLAHKQLHEVLFSYLEPIDVLAYRAIHSECDNMVLHYARTQLQDVVGQDLSRLALRTDSPEASHRRIESSIVKLLTTCGDNIGQLLASAPGGSLGRDLVTRNYSLPAERAGSTLLCSMTEELVKDLLHIDILWIDRAIAARVLPMVAQFAPTLKSLVVSGDCGASDEMMKFVAANCPSLESLAVYYAGDNVTDESITILAQNGRLRSLTIDGIGKKISDKSIGLVATNCSELQLLKLDPAAAFTDASISLVATHCLQLRSLTVSMTAGVTDRSMKIVGMNCAKLEELDVSYTDGNISDASMKLVATNCLQLRKLDVGRTRGAITDESIKLVGYNCRQLVSLNVYLTDAITDESIAIVAANCTQLRQLHLNYTRGRITDRSMHLVATNCKRLELLSIFETAGAITSASLSLLPRCCRVTR